MAMNAKKMIFLSLLLLSKQSFADYFDGNALQKMATSSQAHDISMFRGYVAGIQDFNNGSYFCVPADVRLSQSSAVVQKYLEENPQSWHFVAKQIVIMALTKAFPCEK